MLRFHIGDERRYKTQGYGGHPMNLYVHRRPIDGWLRAGGFTVEAQILTQPDNPVPGGITLARRSAASRPG